MRLIERVAQKAPTLELLREIREGTFSASENVEEKIEAIAHYEDAVQAFIEVWPSEARAKAREIDERVARGEGVGPLAGLVVAIKNNIAIKGRRLTCGSKMLSNYVASYDATVVERLRACDAIIIGCTNMDEFAAGSDTTRGLRGTRNPFDTERVAGGSSGGSAVAVALAMADGALGSDTGGSVRCPASFCGVFGYKPSYGAVSRYGLVDLAMSLDQVGFFGRDVGCIAALFAACSGYDPRDQTTLGGERYGLKLSEKLFRAKVVDEWLEGCANDVRDAVSRAVGALERSGWRIEEVSIPEVSDALAAYELIMYSEFASAMQRYDGLKYGHAYAEGLDLIEAISRARDEALGEEVKRRILLGTYITTKEAFGAWYTKALRARDRVKRALFAALDGCDALIGATMPCTAWRVGERAKPLEMYLADILTVPANLAGLAACSLPISFSGGLPIGLQLLAKGDATLIDAAYSAERVFEREL